ncbi:hypothetical protein VPH35_051954 [Triticum aestivum]
MFRQSVDLKHLSLMPEYLTRRSTQIVGSTMQLSSSSPSSLACAVAIILVIMVCCSLLPFPCSAVCKGMQPHVSSNSRSGGGGGGVPAPRGGEDQLDHGGGGSGGGNQVERTPPAPRGKTPRNHR